MVRTKSESIHRSVLEAAVSLFAEHGIEATSMDAVAAAAGTSKATLYKHWADKNALVLEALSVVFGLYDDPPIFDSGDLRQDFVDALTYQPAPSRQEMHRQLMPHVMAYAARHRDFGERWRERAIEMPQRRMRALIARGVASGALRPDVDDQTSLALLLGPMLYWHIFTGKQPNMPMPTTLAVEVVEAFWRRFGRDARSAVGSRPDRRSPSTGSARARRR